MFICLCKYLLLPFLAFLIAFCVYVKLIFVKENEKDKKVKRIAFLHYQSLVGGGAEKVLWSCISGLLNYYGKNVEITVVDMHVRIGQPELKALIFKNYGIELKHVENIKFVNVKSICLIRSYPVFSLLVQMLASFVVFFECCLRCKLFCFDVLVDTNKAYFVSWCYSAFKKYLVRDCKASFVSYIHLPLMEHHETFLIDEKMSPLKKNYQKCILYLYYLTLTYTIDQVQVNSNWTKNEITRLLKLFSDKTPNLFVVFPPCNISPDAKNNTKSLSKSKKLKLVSFGHIRWQKRHFQQIDIVHKLVSMNVTNVKLTIFGSLSGEKFNTVFYDLCQKIYNLNLQKYVKFCLNNTWGEITQYMSKESVLIGVHTMIDEHFGISVVEMASFGLITLAHKSGGPKIDIFPESLKDQHHFLCETTDEYVDRIIEISKMPDQQINTLINKTREHLMLNFTQKCFESAFVDRIINLL